jgi:hypothetical protein
VRFFLRIHRKIRAMKTKTKQFQRDLQQEKVRLERELNKVALTLEALALLTGERVANDFNGSGPQSAQRPSPPNVIQYHRKLHDSEFLGITANLTKGDVR